MKQGKVVGINGNMVTVALESSIIMNEVGYVINAEGKRLKSEVIRVMGDEAQLQVFEITKGISIGDSCEFTGELLAAELGPGLLGQVYDGLQNPLPELAEQAGYFLERGITSTPFPGKSAGTSLPSPTRGTRWKRPIHSEPFPKVPSSIT